ncbi:MAG TPA: hypothetical protein VGK33_04425 [Chloroflexota bacterium]|jgi:hypothetical protein
MDITLATRRGAPAITGVETRTVGRQRRFVLTRYPTRGGMTDWTITHTPTGCSIMQLVPRTLPPTITNLSAVVRAWDALKGVDWDLIDALPLAGNVNPRRDRERMTAFRAMLHSVSIAIQHDVLRRARL